MRCPDYGESDSLDLYALYRLNHMENKEEYP